MKLLWIGSGQQVVRELRALETVRGFCGPQFLMNFSLGVNLFLWERLANQSWLARCIQQVDATPSDVNLPWKGGVAMGRGRLGLSTIDKREIWSRWRAGQTLHEIGRVYGKCHNTIRAVLLPRGGIPPVARRRSRRALSFAERETISRGMASGSSLREIAGHLHRAASTVSREVARYGGRPSYRAYDADQQAWHAALRPKRCLLAVNSELRDVVASKLMLDWSPEQIAGWLW